MTSVLTDKEKADLRDGTRDIMELIDDVQSAVIKRLAAGVSVEPANSDLADEISAIDCMYRGDPSYEHDAYYMREQAAKRVRNGYLLVTLEQLTTALAAARVQALNAAMNCYSPDDSATDWMDKIRALIGGAT